MLKPLTGRSRHEATTLGGAGFARLGRPSAKAPEASTRSAASPPASIRRCRVICRGLGTRQDLIGGSDGWEGEICLRSRSRAAWGSREYVCAGATEREIVQSSHVGDHLGDLGAPFARRLNRRDVRVILCFIAHDPE